jgi:hypothetical protein
MAKKKAPVKKPVKAPVTEHTKIFEVMRKSTKGIKDNAALVILCDKTSTERNSYVEGELSLSSIEFMIAQLEYLKGKLIEVYSETMENE